MNMVVNTPLEAVLDKVNSILYKTNEMVDTIPSFGNGFICIDSLSTAGRAGVNFYFSPSPVARVFFAGSCVCGIASAAASGTAMANSYVGIPVIGWMGCLSSRGLNRLGKYTFKMGQITDAKSISDLMS
jgi:hypothetical protein